jgi:hypothetical protein
MEGIEFTEVPGILDWMKQQGKGFQPIKDIARHFLSQPSNFDTAVNFSANMSNLVRKGHLRRCYKIVVNGFMSEKDYENFSDLDVPDDFPFENIIPGYYVLPNEFLPDEFPFNTITPGHHIT